MNIFKKMMLFIFLCFIVQNYSYSMMALLAFREKRLKAMECLIEKCRIKDEPKVWSNLLKKLFQVNTCTTDNLNMLRKKRKFCDCIIMFK